MDPKNILEARPKRLTTDAARAWVMKVAEEIGIDYHDVRNFDRVCDHAGYYKITKTELRAIIRFQR